MVRGRSAADQPRTSETSGTTGLFHLKFGLNHGIRVSGQFRVDPKDLISMTFYFPWITQQEQVEPCRAAST